jgi:hypothetical protein
MRAFRGDKTFAGCDTPQSRTPHFLDERVARAFDGARQRADSCKGRSSAATCRNIQARQRGFWIWRSRGTGMARGFVLRLSRRLECV